MKSKPFLCLALLVLAAPLWAQRGGGPPPPPPPPQAGPPRGGGGGGATAGLQMPPGRWWNDAATAQSLGLSPDQVKKMDDIFNGARDHLIDLDAAVQKAEAGLQPLLESQPLDRSKVLNQIDRLAQAKADLEKADAAMLLDLRLQLTPDQWTKLQTQRPPARGGRGQGQGQGGGGENQ